jgi:Flp pilus assembly pilin Flp
MRKLVEFYNRLRYTQLGSNAAEYALLITLIALTIAIGAGALGVAINNSFQAAADAM